MGTELLEPLVNVPYTSGPSPTALESRRGRDTAEEFGRKERALERAPLLIKTLDALPDMVMVLNRHRQIVAANKKLLDVLKTQPRQISGRRPGEVLQCIWCKEGPDGCGTGLHCATCGAVQALMESMATEDTCTRECRVQAGNSLQNVAMDLRVTSTPMDVEGERFLMVAIEDVSHEKRVDVLQRTFFHDVLNTAGCIQGYADYLVEETIPDRNVFSRLHVLTNQLTEEIVSQQDLLRAESGELKVQPTPVKATHALQNLNALFSNHAAAAGRGFDIRESWNGLFTTDRALLMRVLGNMVKNALEATPVGGAVAVNCSATDEAVTFSVTNPGVIPRDVQLQIFQRSFSTKGDRGRGVGTYSIKLLGEQYLRGTVGFTSDAEHGTTFWLRLPMVLTV
jgi:K+-sensing histidine kinase KdpD